MGDPLLPDWTSLVLPRWTAPAGPFADGSSTIQEAFERLVRLTATPGAGSPVFDAADPTQAPLLDILGQSRDLSSPDLGAFETSGPAIFADDFESGNTTQWSRTSN